MKRRLLVFTLVMSISGCLAPAKIPDFVTHMEGFRGHKWGTYIEEIGDQFESQGIDEKRNLEWFTKKNDTLQIGKANVESINYVFHGERFSAVSIIAKGLSNCTVLQEELNARLGKTQPVKGNTFSWDLAHTIVLFSYNEQTRLGMLVVRGKGY